MPYFSSRSPDSDRPRLLLVSYHFPPRRSAGALRWRKFARFLHEAGWDVDVLTTPPPGAQPESSELAELPPGVELHAVPEGPGRLRRFEDGVARRLGGARRAGADSRADASNGAAAGGAGMVPADELSWLPRSPRDLIRVYKIFMGLEEHLAWARSAQRIADDLAAETRYHGVIASAPPWGTLIAARRIASAHALPLLLDFRDPWALPQPSVLEKEAHPLADLLSRRLEAEVVRDASAVVVNTPTVERAMRDRYPFVRFRTILNGVDEVFPTKRRPGEPFRIAYAGTIYMDRDPRVLFEPVGALARDLGLGPSELRVEFIGEAESYDGIPTVELARAAGIADHFRVEPPIPRSRLLERLAEVDVLVSLPQSTPWSTPSKIFEYMGFDAWLLVFAAAGSATAEVLAGSDAIVLDPRDSAGTTAALQRCYERHRRGEAPSGEANRDRFARARRGTELLGLLEEIGWRATPPG